ncbi:hypothetical protein HW532_18555 [Kaustia mangrovi]|uniref:Phage tail protein n=1 Tax=Kaustia mangrovi TaxID=2593653 RepID=A0A7S8HDC1_9HYPH|nr:hypothetical protein [Kaustia mangrovi]QPC44521.1 hypothetical protein HW532_18555 [Kaustia mangrovi]
MAIIDNRTPAQDYLLPDGANDLEDDVLRLVAALSAIDTDVAAILASLAGKADVGHGHAIGDIAGLQGALDGKMDAGATFTLDGLSDVDVAGAANNQVLMRSAGQWIPASLDAAHIVSGTFAEARMPAYLTSAALGNSFAPLSHTHAIAGVTGLQTALDAKGSLASPGLWSAVQFGGVQPLADGASVTPDMNGGQHWYWLLGADGNLLEAPANLPAAGTASGAGILEIAMSGGAFVPAFDAIYKQADGESVDPPASADGETTLYSWLLTAGGAIVLTKIGDGLA